ncbi:MAG: leucine-rich repeat domain-containing protein, partial [Muribaculaceae bacterium]|nr:leucine-rich repeat domain-containing protein [Muribaculaceae bacterium]
MKKLLLFLFGVLMAFPSFAHEFKYTYKGQTLTYTVLDENAKTCEIKYSSSVNEVSGTLIIPSLAMDGNIAYSVTEIGVRAFCDCSNLTSVAIPNSVTTICESAFCRCSSLKSVSIPNSVTLIDNYAFYDCTGLTRAEFASVESLCQIEFKNFCSNPLYYSQKLYLGGKEIRGLYIPNTVTSIGNYAIYGGAGLSWVFISNSVTSIGAYAFCGCTGLTSISIPNSVTYIGDAAFFMCTGLKRAEFSSLESLLKIRFVGSYSNPLRNAHSLYIDGKEITEVVIPETVTTIGNYSFEGFTNLKSVTIPGSVTSIGIGAFSKCSSLKSVTIPNSVTTIDRYSFSCCTGLESVIIPGSVTTIDSNAFEYCTALKSVTIPGSVTSLGGSVFENCSGLTKV